MLPIGSKVIITGNNTNGLKHFLKIGKVCKIINYEFGNPFYGDAYIVKTKEDRTQTVNKNDLKSLNLMKKYKRNPG